MAKSGGGIGRVLGGVLAAGAVGAATAVFAARRSKVSVRAWAVGHLAGLFAPDLSDPSAFEDAVRRNREAGPAGLPAQHRRGFGIVEGMLGPDRVQTLRPRRAKDGPCMLYLHGGAYVMHVQAMQWNIGVGLLSRLGGEVVAPDYPLAPESGWAEGLACVERVYRALVRQKGAANIVVIGDSAGGGLALALLHRLRDSGGPLPAAAILFSPWLDAGCTGEDQPALERRDPALTIAMLRRAGELWADGLPLDDPRVSPLFGDHDGLPPTLVFSGSRDVLDSDALRLKAAWPQVDHRHYPNMMHVWPAGPIPEARRALDEAAEFVRRKLGKR